MGGFDVSRFLNRSKICQLACLFSVLFGTAVAARSQCYTFTSGDAGTITFEIGDLPKPTVYPGGGVTEYIYDVESAENSVTMTIGGHRAKTDGKFNLEIDIVNSAEFTTLVFEVLVESSANAGAEYVEEQIALYASAVPGYPDGLLPKGLAKTLPAITDWAGSSPNVINAGIETSNGHLVADLDNAVITSIGSDCPTCPISSTTLATVPGKSASRTTIGIGEFVQLDSDESRTWKIASGHGCLTESEPVVNRPGTCKESIDGKRLYFTAPYSEDVVEIEAAESDGSCSETFNVEQPKGLYFQRVIAPGYDFNWPAGRIGMWAAAFIVPGDVSFANIGIAELDIDHPYTRAPIVPQTVVSIGGENATLFACDRDYVPVLSDDFEDTDEWVYTWGSAEYSKANKWAFSKVKTQLSSSYLDYRFTKGQYQQRSGESWQATPDAPEALLHIASTTRGSVAAPKLTDSQCRADVLSQCPGGVCKEE